MTNFKRAISLVAAGAASLALGTTALADQEKQLDPMDAEAAQADAPKQGDEKDTVFFKQSSAKLTPAAKKDLDTMVEWAKANPDQKLAVVGFASEPGTEKYNLKLSERRAKAVRAYLKLKGIDESRVEIDAMGESITPYAVDAMNRRTVVFGEKEQEAAMEEQRQKQLLIIAQAQPAPQADDGPDVVVVDTKPDVVVVEDNTPSEPVVIEKTETKTVMVENDDPTYGDDSFASRYGVAVSLGGGVMGFTNEDVRGYTDTGGTWEARATFGTRMPIGIEAAYVGSAQDINALGLEGNAIFLGNGGEGAVRLHILPSQVVQPYVFGGLGYTRYSLVNEDSNTSNVANSLDVGYIPVGAGVGFRYAGFLFDIRGTLRPAFGDELFETNAGGGDDNPDLRVDDSNLTNWSAAAKVGWEF